MYVLLFNSTVRLSSLATIAVPLITGVGSFVVCDVTTGTAGAVVSMINSPFVLSIVALPAPSVTVAATLYLPSTSTSTDGTVSVQVWVLSLYLRCPSPSVYVLLFTSTVRLSSLASVAVPLITGVRSVVVCDVTVGIVGDVVSITSSPVVGSLVALPALSVTVAVTLYV